MRTEDENRSYTGRTLCTSGFFFFIVLMNSIDCVSSEGMQNSRFKIVFESSACIVFVQWHFQELAQYFRAREQYIWSNHLLDGWKIATCSTQVILSDQFYKNYRFTIDGFSSVWVVNWGILSIFAQKSDQSITIMVSQIWVGMSNISNIKFSILPFYQKQCPTKLPSWVLWNLLPLMQPSNALHNGSF